MADDAALAPSEDPFEQLGGDKTEPVSSVAPAVAAAPAAAPSPTANDNEPSGDDPFAELGDVGPSTTSATGAFARGAEKSVVPAAASLAGAGAGGAAAVGIGAALGTTVGPWGTLAGAVGGGLVAGYGGSYLQNIALSHLPDSWRDTLGVDDRTARLDEAQHGTASFLGGLLPFAVTMRPSAEAGALLPKNATAMQQIMAHPATSRVFGGAINGGIQIAQDEVSTGHADWKKAAISTAFGVVFNRPNAVGETITEAGAHPVRSLTGTPHPTVAQVSDLNIMGPGVTESVFQGTQERAPTAAMTAQEHARVEQGALGEPPEPDLHGVARQMEPELFGQYEELLRRRDTFAVWHGEGPGHEMAEKHLAATDAEIREMAPQVAAAYRRAEETIGPAAEEPEQFPSFAAMLAARENGTGRPADAQTQTPEAQPAGEPSVPAGGEAPGLVPGQEPVAPAGAPVPQRTIGEQRSAIASDVAERLIAAGRPEEEARAAGQLVAARTVTRALRFEGKLGTPEELHAREGSAIGGPSGKAREPAQVIREAAAQGDRQHEAAQVAQSAAAETAAKSPEPGLLSQDFETSTRIKNEWRQATPFAETKPFIEASWHNQRSIGEAGERIASELGADFRNPGIKARAPEDIATIKDDAKRKAAETGLRRLENKAKRFGSVGTVTDQVRAGFDAKTPEQADAIVQKLSQQFQVVDEGWQTVANSRYFDRKLYVRFPDGMIGEIQIWPPGMFAAKEHGGGHVLYGGARELPSWHPLIPEFNKAQQELYDPVRARLSDEWKAVLGNVGSEPNSLPNASAESGLPLDPTSAALTSSHEPLMSAHASEGVQNAGRPSQETDLTSDMFGVPDENIGSHSEPVNSAIDAIDKINALSPAEQKRELPKYTAAAEQAPKGVDQPAGVFMFDPTALNVDAKRFQFKSGGDEYGVTGALRNVAKWDQAKAQSIIVWEQNDGKLFVADGHQRAGLARRLTEKNGAKGIELPGILYREKDGISADDIRAQAAVTNIANGSGSAIDGAKVLRARPDLMDGSLPLSVGKGKQAAALARLGDEPFKMVVSDVIPENYGAVVGELIPNDHARQEAAIKAIARFEPKNADEAAVLTQRVAQAELAKAEEGAQGSMFGDLETAESTAGEEMKIVGRAIADLKKDKSLFRRVVANAGRIEETGSQIRREAAQSIASDSEVFAKTLTSDAYSAGPIRDELVAAARDLKNGKASIGETSARIIAALREQVEAHGLNRTGDIGGNEPAKEFAQTDQLDFEAGAEGKPQSLIPGVSPVTQRDLIQAAANNPLKPKVAQKAVGGLFGDSMDQKELFQRDQVQTPEFKKWFGESKVVDADGQPRVMYHGAGGQEHARGTLGGFDTFDRLATSRIIKGRNAGMDTVGSWFSDVPTDKGAGMYAGGERGSIYPVYLSINNPWRPKSFEEFLGKMHEAAGSPLRTMADARAKGVPFGSISPEPLREWLKTQGYDGIAFPKGEVDGAEQSVWVALEPTQIKSSIGNTGEFNPLDPNILHQTARGTIKIAPGKRPIISLLKDANASTFVHESGHQFLEEMMRDAAHGEAPEGLKADAKSVLDWMGVEKTGDIQTKHHEKFARGFEQYLREGVAPSKDLAGVFAKFRDWLLSIYQSIKGLGTEISPEIRNVFDRMLEMEPHRTVIAPERMQPDLLHDIHETEAQHTPPHEAEPAMDRIVAETARHLEDQPPEIRRELESAAVKVQEANAAAAPAGEGGAGGGGASEVVGDSGAPGPESASGDGGAEHGAVKPGGSGAGAESSGAQRIEPRSKLGDSAGTTLAPGPTDLFGTESPYTDKAGNIRLDTLNTSDDVKRAIRDSAASNNDFIGDRRGVVTDGQVLELADDIGMVGAEKMVAQHVAGQAFNAEQVVALRKLLRESAGNVSAAAKKFAASGSDEDVLAFAQAKDRLQMVQKTVAGVTAEAGRALRAFRTLPGEQDTKAIEQMVAEATGKTLFQLKNEAKLAAGIDTPQKMNKFLQNVDNRSAGGMILEAWINGLLSGPTTQISNIVSNAIFSIQHYGVERAVSAIIGGALHTVGREGTYTRLGEVSAAAKGMVQGTAPALLAAGESFKKGSTGLLPGEEEPASGILSGILHDEMLQRGTLDPKATMRDVGAAIFATSRSVRDAIVTGGALIKAGGVEGSPFMSTKYDLQGAIPDIQVRGVNAFPVGTAIRATGRFLATADTFAASLNYSAGINATAYRIASDEGLTGSAFAQRVAQLRNDPTPEMMQEARTQARVTTFMDKSGPLVKAINNLTSLRFDLPIFGSTQPLKFVAPFTNVVSRILDQTLIKRTPIGAIFSKELQSDLLGRNGNIAQDTAAARMLLGSSVLLAFGALAAEGYVTGSGPKDSKENAIWRTVNQPHSVKIGGTWYAIQKLGPMGMFMSMAADLHDIAHIVDEGDWGKAGATLFHAIVQNTLDQSSLQGPAELIKAIETPDQYGNQYIKALLSSFVPGSVNWIAKSRDPYIRQTWGILDAIKAKLPFYSETLNPKIDLWGEPVPAREQLGGMTGIYTQKAAADPVNKAMADLGMGKGMPEKKVRNVELTPDQYEYFSRMSGRMAKMRLDVMVRSPQWNTFPAYMKMKVINETIDGSRTSAEGLLFAKWPGILKQARDDKMTLIKTGKKAIH